MPEPVYPPARPTDGDRLIRQGLKLPHLQLMVALEETGQISAPAAVLNMTQPAASRMTSGARSRVSVGAVTAPAIGILLPAIRGTQVAHPDVEVSVQVDTSDRPEEALLSRDLDFYIGRVLGGMEARSVSLRPIGPEPLALIVRTEHPLTRLAMIAGSNAIAPISRRISFGGMDGMSGPITQLPLASDLAVIPYALVRRRDQPLSPSAAVFLKLIENRLDAG